MKGLFQTVRIIVFLIISVIFSLLFTLFMTSAPFLGHGLTKSFLLILLIIICSLVCPRDLGKPVGQKRLLIDALTALILAVVWYLCSMKLSTLPMVPIFIVVMCAISLLPVVLRHKPILLMLLFALFISQLCFTFIFSDPMFATLSLVVALICALVWAANNRLAFLKAATSIFGCTALFFIYYAMNFDIKLIVPVVILITTSFLIFLQYNWRASSRVMKFALFAVTLHMFLSCMAIFSFVCCLPSPVQALVVGSQKGADILLHPRKMPYGARVFVPRQKDWLVALYDLKLDGWELNTYITLLNKEGKIIRPPLIVSRIDYVEHCELFPNIYFVPGLEGKAVCALDVDKWRMVVCSKENWNPVQITVSSDGEFVAAYSDGPYEKRRIWAYHFGGALKRYAENGKGYEQFDALSVPKSLENCCWGSVIKFIENRRFIIHDYQRAFYIVDVSENGLSLKDTIEDSDEKFKLHATQMAFSKDPDKMFVPVFFYIKSLGGAIETINLKDKRVEKLISNPLMTGLRVLVYAPEFDVYCAANELGLLFIFDNNFKMKKILYAGAGIRSIHLEGSELYFASQAGLVKVDLNDVEF